MAQLENERIRSSDDSEIDLGQLLDTLNFYKYKILLASLLGLLLGLIYAFVALPVYQANALVKIEPKNQSSNILGDLKSLGMGGLGTTPESAAEIELVKSRLVIGKTIDDLDLTTQIRPVYTPVIGLWLHHFLHEATPLIQIGNFTVPERYIESAQTAGKGHFSLRNVDGRQYELVTPDKKSYTAEVGKTLTTPEGIVLNVASMSAPAGQRFQLYKQTRLKTVDDVLLNLAVADKGKNTNVLGLSYNETNPANAKVILNAIVNNYAAQNRDREVQLASASLNFINAELPNIKASLSQAEDELNVYRNKNATIDISTEAKDVLQSLTQIQMQLTDLKTKQAEVAQLFTPDHPNYQALEQKKAILQKAERDLTHQISRMPQTQQDIIRLNRAVEIQQAVYLQLLGRQQELSITRASTLGNVRIVDQAVTLEKAITPNKPLIILASTLAATILAALYAIAKTLLRRGIGAAEDVEILGLPVFASIPFSQAQSKRDLLLKRSRKFTKDVRSNFLLAQDDPADVAVEAIRGLRTSLYFTQMEAANKNLLISGATPSVGKTFVSVNLATVIAQSDKKVLLIDTDMRKGYMHEMLHMALGKGLSDYLSGQSPLQEVLTTTPVQGLDFISRGAFPPNPAELLLGERLQTLLTWASEHYDNVILDAPPVLAVTDAAILGQFAGTVLIVARFEQNTQKDIEATLQRFANNNIRVNGAIINGLKQTANNYATYEAYSRYAQEKK